MAGSTIKTTPTNSKARNRPMSSHVQGDPGVPALCHHWVVSGPLRGREVWFHPGMCERTKRMTHSWYLHDKTSFLENLTRVHDCEFPTPIIVSTSHFHQILSCSILKHHTCMEHRAPVCRIYAWNIKCHEVPAADGTEIVCIY